MKNYVKILSGFANIYGGVKVRGVTAHKKDGLDATSGIIC